MSPRIRVLPTISDHDLRQLVIDSIDQIVETPQLLDPELPWDGGPLLVIDAKQQPILIGFEVHDACRALFNGLAALEAFESNRTLLSRFLPKLTESSITGTPRLIILVDEVPPALSALSRSMPQLDVLLFRVLEINHQTCLFVEPAGRGNSSTRREDVVGELEQQPYEVQKAGLPEQQSELTEQENAYFKYL